MFSFGAAFIYKFVSGKTDYRLGLTSFEYELEESKYKNVDLFEQELNLTNNETERLIEYLYSNYKPENRFYRYNFFFDNGATRPRDIIEKSIYDSISYPSLDKQLTFRNIIYNCLNDSPWYIFGIDLCLGSETDRLISDYELMFLPLYMMETYNDAVIITDTGTRKLIKDTVKLNSKIEIKTENSFFRKFTPNIVFWTLLILIIVHTVFYNLKNLNDIWFDSILFIFCGLIGTLIFYLSFISEHPCTNPNYNLLWLKIGRASCRERV